MDPGNRRAVLAALGANSGIAVAKFVGYAFTGAASMLAEAIHSVADAGNQALLLWGGAQAARSPTSEHPFGYGRERYFWSFVVALVIFALGSVFAIYEGVHKLGSDEPVTNVLTAVSILAVAIVLEGLSFRTAIVEARKVKGVASWAQFVRRSKNPELPVVLLEDLGALLGLVLALLGVSLAWITGDPVFDALGSIAIGVLLGVIAWLLAVEMKSLIIGEAASARHQDQIRAAIEEGGACRLITFRTQHLGPDQLLVAAKVEFDGSSSFEQLTEAIDVVEGRIRAAVPIARIVYIEPDVFEPAVG